MIGNAFLNWGEMKCGCLVHVSAKPRIPGAKMDDSAGEVNVTQQHSPMRVMSEGTDDSRGCFFAKAV